MIRNEIINTIGRQFLVTNIENDEYSYKKAFTAQHKDFSKVKMGTYKDLDIRFLDKQSRVAVLVETKQNFDQNYAKAKEQLNAYMSYERALTGYSVIGILANTNDNRIRVWRDHIEEDTFLAEQTAITSFADYRNIVSPARINNKEQVIRNTYKLNETLHGMGISEGLRSQFVGTCILALKNHLQYKGLSTSQILSGIYDVLSQLLNNDLNRADKLSILHTKVLQDQKVRQLESKDIIQVLDDISSDIMPYINEDTAKGQDLLNLFFTTFNKYVGKAAEIVLFLLATMTIVEILVNNGCFDFLTPMVRTRKAKRMLWALSALTFLISANLDNLTTTTLMLIVVHQLVSGRRYRFIYGSS